MPTNQHMETVANLAAERAVNRLKDEMIKAVDKSMERHLSLCEARNAFVPNGTRLGMEARVAILERPRSWWDGPWGRVVTTVAAAAIVAVAVLLLTEWAENHNQASARPAPTVNPE